MIRLAAILACAALAGCQFPFGGRVGVTSLPPKVELDAHPPPPLPADPPPVTMRTLEGIVSVTRPVPGAGARANYQACADFDALRVGKDHLYWRVFCEALPPSLPGATPAAGADADCPDCAQCPEAKAAPCPPPTGDHVDALIDVLADCKAPVGKTRDAPDQIVEGVGLHTFLCTYDLTHLIEQAKELRP